MGDIAFNVSQAAIGYYWGVPGTSDALIAVPLEATGLEADDTLADYDTLAALLAGANNEQTTIGRKTLTTPAVTVNDTTNATSLTADDITWTSPSGNALGALVVCYVPNTGTSTDSDIIPLFKQGFAVTSFGASLSASFAPAVVVTWG